jgi:hypothetical protein
MARQTMHGMTCVMLCLTHCVGNVGCLVCAAGSDPPGIKLRAAKALEAVDYFVPGYWVFSKLIQSLSDIGYDNNNMVSLHGMDTWAGGGGAELWSGLLCALDKQTWSGVVSADHQELGQASIRQCHVLSSSQSVWNTLLL